MAKHAPNDCMSPDAYHDMTPSLLFAHFQMNQRSANASRRVAPPDFMEVTHTRHGLDNKRSKVSNFVYYAYQISEIDQDT